MINIDRLMAHLESIARIGRLEDGGIRRRALSDEDLHARSYLSSSMERAGLSVRTDQAGNVIGRREPDGAGATDREAAVLMGSHIDTIERAGMYDGVTGVFAAIECVRTLGESGKSVARPIEVVAFNDEEERFFGFLGSYAFSGELDYQRVADVVDVNGASLMDQFAKIGLDARSLGAARRDPATVAGFLELHIEQGPILDREGYSVGVVEQVKGNYRWEIAIRGQTDHAGAPWEGRKDAFMAMNQITNTMLEYRHNKGDSDSTVTIGRVMVQPNIETAQPGDVVFSVDFRSPNKDFLTGADEELSRVITECMAEAGQRVSRRPLIIEDPVDFDRSIIGIMQRSAERLGYKWRRMYSGAGHDAQVIGRRYPAGMIFVPSVGGRSHCPEEYTSPEDIEKGANVLYETMLEMASAST